MKERKDRKKGRKEDGKGKKREIACNEQVTEERRKKEREREREREKQ